MDLNTINILAQTKDMVIVQTENFLDTIHNMQSYWRHLIELIPDDYYTNWVRVERTILCYWKDKFYEECLEAQGPSKIERP